MIRRSPSLTTRRRAPVIWQTLMEVEPNSTPLVNRSSRSAKLPDHDAREGLYIISVAARLLEMHPQTLRKYERIGLVRPSRTIGMLRLYSKEDVAQLRAIKYLVEALHLNLAGVELIMEMVKQAMTKSSHKNREEKTKAAGLNGEFAYILSLFRVR